MTAPLHLAPDAEERIEFLLYEHREDALTCYDHPEAYCCVCGEHEVGSYRKHLTHKIARLIEDARREDRETEADIREQVLTEYANLPVAASERAVLNLTAERDALRERLAGVRWRVEVACDGYEALMDDDVPSEFDEASYQEGAAEAARQIRAALHPTEADRG